MIERYTRLPMAKVWAPEMRFQKMLEVEVAVAKAQAVKKIIPQKAARDISARSKFNVKRISEIEKTTRHDVIAFVTNVAENIGESGRFFHYGLTSSDVLDTALSLQIAEAGRELITGFDKLESALIKQIKKHARTLCSGRTHGMHAEVTSFGVKLAGYLAEMKRAKRRVLQALEQSRVGKISGAVGVYSNLSADIESEVCRRLKLTPETVSTQVLPRDRHAEVLLSLAMLGGFFERLAVELRHLQRTELSEASESFTKGQKGSSAMPHKKNPISAENLTGQSRLLRSYSLAALENIALWHERDISHSSVERVIFPDAFILADYSLHRAADLIAGLIVDKERMRKNMDLSQGALFSSQVLTLLVQKGMSREEAYIKVQSISHSLTDKQNLKDQILKNTDFKKLLSKKDLDEIFSGKKLFKNFDLIINRALRLKEKV
jgi:adenylosuccinate lyase